MGTNWGVLASPRNRELRGQRAGGVRSPSKRGPVALPGTRSAGGPLPSGSDSVFPPPLSYLSRDLTSPSGTEKRERQGQIQGREQCWAAGQHLLLPPAHLYSPKVSSFIGRASESTWVSSLSFTGDTEKARYPSHPRRTPDPGPIPGLGTRARLAPCAPRAPGTLSAAPRSQEVFDVDHSPHVGLAAVCCWSAQKLPLGPPPAPDMPMPSCRRLGDRGWGACTRSIALT